jgi:Xaa-Pro aminopeptidase
MRSDLDHHMGALDIDAIVILGDRAENPYRDYVSNRAKAHGMIIKKRGHEAVFVVNGMEVDEAKKSGLHVKTAYDFGFAELYEKYAADLETLRREMLLNYFHQLEISGQVAFYGVADVGETLNTLLILQNSGLPITMVTGKRASMLFNSVMDTKDEHELTALREVGRKTSHVVRQVWDYLSSHRAEKEGPNARVLNKDGQPLTIGHVRAYIRGLQTQVGLIDAEGFIFAQGRDAGVPHSHGEDGDELRTGQTIVFDYYPRDLETGYFHDMTRTWSLGCLPDEEAKSAFDDVWFIFQKTRDAMRIGELTNTYQLMTLDFFEERNHPTLRAKPGTNDGYVHSLGHGIGLNIHEAPYFREKSTDYTLMGGHVFTIEPGLYYPERGYGIRIEDTVYLDHEGNLHTLTDFPYDLVLPLNG